MTDKRKRRRSDSALARQRMERVMTTYLCYVLQVCTAQTPLSRCLNFANPEKHTPSRKVGEGEGGKRADTAVGSPGI